MKLLRLIFLPFIILFKIFKKLLDKFFNLFKFEKKVKYTEYDYFIDCLDKTLSRGVDFRAEYKTEQINFIINPLKPIKTPKKPKKEVQEQNEQASEDVQTNEK